MGERAEWEGAKWERGLSGRMRHLVHVRGEVERGGVAVVEAVVGEHVVEAEVARVIRHVVHARMAAEQPPHNVPNDGTRQYVSECGISITACLKWLSTFELFSRAMVISEQHISRNAANVEKIPCLPFSMPKPAQAEKLPRSITPDWMYTSGCASLTFIRPVDPPRSESITRTFAIRSSLLILARILFVTSPNATRIAAEAPLPSYLYGSADGLIASIVAIAASSPRAFR